MKLYIIFGSIVGIGGWQIYIDGKAQYLKSKGWDVVVFSDKRSWLCDAVELSGLKEFDKYRLIELFYTPLHMTKKQQYKLIDKMISSIEDIENYEEIWIESTSIYNALWAEVLAKRLQARHISYLLHSYFNDISVDYVNFFAFKHSRNELAGMDKMTLPNLFSGYKIIQDYENYYFEAAGNKPCIEEEYHLSTQMLENLNRSKYVIGSFGTLEKPHIIDIFQNVLNFVEQYPNEVFSYIVIGKSTDGRIERQMKLMVGDKKNIRLILVGAIYPVPKKIFEYMDVCIASWGSAIVAAESGCTTIKMLNDYSVDVESIVGYEKYLNSNKLVETLRGILIYEELKGQVKKPVGQYPDSNITNKDFLEFFERIKFDRDYYDVSKMNILHKKQKIKRILIIVLGIEVADKLFNIFRNKIENWRVK